MTSLIEFDINLCLRLDKILQFGPFSAGKLFLIYDSFIDVVR